MYLQRTRNLKFSMVAAYNIAVRRLYNPLFERRVPDPTQLTRGDFDRVVAFLRESGYKNLYDAISHLQVIADTIDNLQLTEIAIHFEHDAKPEKRRHNYISLHDPARIAQLKESGIDPDGARRRRSFEERIAHLQAENAALITQRDRLYEALSVIAHNCLLKGLDVEGVLGPLRKQ
ncbi:hypothetical protein [Pseudomonas sp. IT-P218]|uniref:hypothetical protein n=1 Tax=Pseudomonas sp. IT-P218 TaxID=3026449 RepID=UPI0039E175F2